MICVNVFDKLWKYVFQLSSDEYRSYKIIL